MFPQEWGCFWRLRAHLLWQLLVKFCNREILLLWKAAHWNIESVDVRQILQFSALLLFLALWLFLLTFQFILLIKPILLCRNCNQWHEKNSSSTCVHTILTGPWPRCGMFPRCRLSICVKATVATVVLIQLLYIPLTVFLYWNQISIAIVPTTTTTPKPMDEQTTVAMPTNETLEYFLWEYEDYCHLELRPKPSNVRAWRLKVGRGINETDPEICPCIPDTLGKIWVRCVNV